ncbi:MAG: Ig-like domain-containing protein, partial [Gemmatimonadaceae bacterium]
MRLRRLISLGLAAVASACGGGGDGGGGPSGPAAVASVQISASATTLEVGSTLPTSVTLTDASGKVLSGRSVTYQSSATNIATVDAIGTVTGVAPGAVTITATSEGKSGALALTVTPVAVNSVTIDQRTPSIKQGESATLTAKTFDFLGREVTGRTITWSSASASIATVTSGGIVTGVTPGSVFIRAESEGKRDSVSLRVRSLIVPAITGSSPDTLKPGITATIDGTNFAATPAGNTVFLNSTPVVVTAATATRLTITVPSSTLLPCSATGPVPLVVVVNSDSALGSAGLQVATTHTLGLGQSVLYTSQAELMCNEFTVTGGTYLITAFNYDNSPSARINFSVIGAATGSTAANVVSARVPAPFGLVQGFPTVLPPEVQRQMQRQRAHLN